MAGRDEDEVLNCGEDFQARLQNVPIVRKLKLSSHMQPHSAEIEHLHPRDGTAMTRILSLDRTAWRLLSARRKDCE